MGLEQASQQSEYGPPDGDNQFLLFLLGLCSRAAAQTTSYSTLLDDHELPFKPKATTTVLLCASGAVISYRTLHHICDFDSVGSHQILIMPVPSSGNSEGGAT